LVVRSFASHSTILDGATITILMSGNTQTLDFHRSPDAWLVVVT
jgi:hypothetical protein